MAIPVKASPDPSLDLAVKNAADGYLSAARALDDASFWAVKMFVAANVFLEHLEIFDGAEDPVPLFQKMFNRAEGFLTSAKESGVGRLRFPIDQDAGLTEDVFEDYVSGLFSDVWIRLTDDIYFDESFAFTKERFEKSGVDPAAFFRDRVVLDAGCGSGKFSAAIARFGAKKVIGLDIGERGLEFARQQAQKVPYGAKLEYVHGSLLDIPMPDNSVDIVWSNGVAHHTLNYERCLMEFARIIKPGGWLYLYVNGRFGLFELLLDTLRAANAGIPRALFQHYLHSLGINSGRIYFMMDCFYAPYEWKGGAEVRSLLAKHGFGEIKQMLRGVAFDAIERLTTKAPFAQAKYGEGQLKFLARRT